MSLARSSWTWATVGSLVFHVGLVLAASALPEGPRSSGGPVRDELFTPGAVIPIEAVEPSAVLAEPTRAPVFPSSDEPTRSATAPDRERSSAEPKPNQGAEPPPSPDEAERPPNDAPGLSLSGQRDDARAARGGGKVVVDPSSLKGSRGVWSDSVENPGVGGGAVQGPTPPAKGASDYAFKRERGKRIYRDPGGRFIATLRADGRVDFRNKGARASLEQIGVGDPSLLISAAAGEDPYARAKAKLLKATFELRLKMAVSFQKKQINKRLARLERELEKIWADERRDLAARKELLFQRWDECDEPAEFGAGSAELPGFGEVEGRPPPPPPRRRELGSAQHRTLHPQARAQGQRRGLHRQRARGHEPPPREQASVLALLISARVISG